MKLKTLFEFDVQVDQQQQVQDLIKKSREISKYLSDKCVAGYNGPTKQMSYSIVQLHNFIAQACIHILMYVYGKDSKAFSEFAKKYNQSLPFSKVIKVLINRTLYDLNICKPFLREFQQYVESLYEDSTPENANILDIVSSDLKRAVAIVNKFNKG